MPQREHYFSSGQAFPGRIPERAGGTLRAAASFRPGWGKNCDVNADHTAELVGWFTEAGREYGRWRQFSKIHREDFRKDAVDSLSDNVDRRATGEIIHHRLSQTRCGQARRDAEAPKFVKEWKMNDLVPSLRQSGERPVFHQRPHRHSLTAQCIQCHKFGNDGGPIGPDLTAVSSRFGRRDILVNRSLIRPRQYPSNIRTRPSPRRMAMILLAESSRRTTRN